MNIKFNPPFSYKNEDLYFENIPLNLLTDKFQTPFYVYSVPQIINNFNRFKSSAIKYGLENHLICYALKANANCHIISTLADLNAGADIVSGGELKRALSCGIAPNKIVFSGVGKTINEISEALSLHQGHLYSFNVESIDELELINNLAREKNICANIALRLNPQVQAKTHKHISTALFSFS